jgi:hypothetical protein
MATARYRATINGFWCRNETWDDVFNWDGKHDEVFLDVNTKVVNADGTVLQNFDSESELMGDTWRLPNRIQAGSASDRGGIVTGDKFPPVDRPWLRSGGLNDLRFPPFTIWEGELRDGQNMVMLTPTIWEWDPGAGFWDGWLAWQVQVDDQYGKRAKEIFGKIWPVAAPVFDAVSLGIQTVGTMAGIWSPLGQSMRRPIGTRRNPADPDGTLFNPITIALNTETAEYLSSSNLQGYGNGIVELRYTDDPYLRGVYSIFVQIEKLSGGTASQWADVGHANDVVSMTAMDGRLFAATGDNRLWVRDAVDHEIDWTPIGHANEVVGLAATGGRLFCATRDNRLWSREATPVELDWTPIGHANGVVGMTALNGSLFCATSDNLLWVRPPLLTDIDWTRIGHANDVRAMAAGGNSLYCTTVDGNLWRRDPVLADVNWQQVGTAPQVRALAATSQGLFAATSGNRLLMRQLP